MLTTTAAAPLTLPSIPSSTSVETASSPPTANFTARAASTDHPPALPVPLARRSLATIAHLYPLGSLLTLSRTHALPTVPAIFTPHNLELDPDGLYIFIAKSLFPYCIVEYRELDIHTLFCLKMRLKANAL